jgi:hypothetical protein
MTRWLRLLTLAFGVFFCFAACGTKHHDFADADAGGTSGGDQGGTGAEGGARTDDGGNGAIPASGAPSGGEGGTGGTDTEPSGGSDGGLGSGGGDTVELKQQGEACTANEDCESTNCRDEVCCDTACDGPCEACVEAHTSAPDGTCAPVLPGADPHDACEATAVESCGTDGSCDGAGECRKYGSNQVCAGAMCSGSQFSAARTCDGEGTCDPVTSMACGDDPCSTEGCEKPCTVPADCPTGSFCGANKICHNQLTNGAQCGAAGECRSKFCVDGVCCESACTGTCNACSKSKTGQDSGRCVGVAANQDPDNECAVDNANACGRDGTCSGGGACKVKSLGTACGAATCSGSTLTPQGSCDGASSCDGGTPQACPGNRTCASATACRTTCTADAHCISGYYCASGACVKKKTQGSSCGAANECSTAACRDSVCCESACGLACQACSNATTGLANGKCGARSGFATQGCPADNPTACVDLDGDLSNCGACGNSCPSTSIPGATRTCNNGACGTVCPAGTLGDGLNVCIPVSTIAADQQFTCGILSTGKVSCWGDTSEGIDPVGAGVSNFVFTSISASWNKRVCGIRDNGQIACWGSLPSTHTGPYIALAMGGNHACGIKANQSLDCWSTDGDTVIEAEPSGKYKGIASMDHYACAIISGGASDGKLKCWGDSFNYSASPPSDSFKRVIGGANHACGIKTDDNITCWGLLYYPQFPAATKFKTLGYGGVAHYCGILTDNSIFCWGSDGGLGGPNASIPAGSFKALALGDHHTCGVTTGGQVVCAGSEDTYGQGANQPGPFQGYW